MAAADLAGSGAGLATGGGVGVVLWLVLTGTLLAAATVGGRQLVRVRSSARAQADPTRHVSRDPKLSAFLCAALYDLAYGRLNRGLPVPDVQVVFVADERLVVHFSQPPAEPPFAPWRVEADGQAWTVHAVDLSSWQRVGLPFPALVALGSADGWEVLVDLEQAPGLVALAGDLRQARRVANAIAFELATSAWSAETMVTRVGWPDQGYLPPDRVREAASLPSALTAAAAVARRASLRLGQLDAANIATGRMTGRDRTELGPHVLLLAEPPGEEAIDQAIRLVGDAHSPVVILCVGDSPFARWRCAVGADGRIALDPLGLRLRPIVATVEEHQRQLGAAAVTADAPAAMVEVDIAVRPTPGEGPTTAGRPETGGSPGRLGGPDPVLRPAAAASASGPATSAGDLTGRAAGVAPAAGEIAVDHPARRRSGPAGSGPAAPPPGTPAGWRSAISALRRPVLTQPGRDRQWPAAVQVDLLGPVEVRAPGPLPGDRRELLTELAVVAAAHPDGLAAAVLVELVAAAGAGADPASVLRELTRWLGTGGSGSPRLRELPGGWTVLSEVRVDWQLFRELVVAAEPDNERARLVTALALIRGPLSAGVRCGAYARHAVRLATDGAAAIVPAAARRAAELAWQAGDPGNAEWTLRRGLALLPATQALWRELLMLRAEQEPGSVRDVADEMRRALTADTGSPQVEPETAALLARLAPAGLG